jgi:acetate kinase
MPGEQVLVVNCGSSSLKLARIDVESGAVLEHALAERLGEPDARFAWHSPAATETREVPQLDHEGALAALLDRVDASELSAVGHRVVHGGEAFRSSTLLAASALAAIERCTELAPLHNPANLIGIRAAQRAFPSLPHVAVFDTAFHQSMPARAYLYGLPYPLYEQHRIRRYGFHGTSHEYVAGLAAQRLKRPLEELQLITLHLGNGASACAVRQGKSMDTSMGFTPLEGLVMGTRSGDVDPNLHAFLAHHLGIDLTAISHLLNNESGLLGLSGASNDMRTLLELGKAGHERAELAVEVFCYRLAKTLLGLGAALERIDAVVFTGGIGEHAAPVRERTLAHLGLLGARIDPELNAKHGEPAGGRITREDSGLLALVVPTNEELSIARESLRVARATSSAS